MVEKPGRTWKTAVLVAVVIFAGWLLYFGFELWHRAANP
jgi:hypothetical protein